MASASTVPGTTHAPSASQDSTRAGPLRPVRDSHASGIAAAARIAPAPAASANELAKARRTAGFWIAASKLRRVAVPGPNGTPSAGTSAVAASATIGRIATQASASHTSAASGQRQRPGAKPVNAAPAPTGTVSRVTIACRRTSAAAASATSTSAMAATRPITSRPKPFRRW